MAGIFISYRRSDSGMAAGRLYDHLSGRFGSSQVFMDVTTLALGENFVQAIQKTIEKCDVLIAVIGQHWLTAVDEFGQRRLNNPGDYVRQEVTLALRCGLHVIPVLVDEAAMPRQDDLPDDLKPLALCNALNIRNESFKYNVDRLIGAILDARSAAELSLSPLELTLPFSPIAPVQRAKQERNQTLWIIALLMLLPFNCSLGAVPILVASMALAIFAPIRWPYAKKTILATQIASVIGLGVLMLVDYSRLTEQTSQAAPVICLGAAIPIIVLNLVVVRNLLRRTVFQV